jgi:hypothetical protein
LAGGTASGACPSVAPATNEAASDAYNPPRVVRGGAKALLGVVLGRREVMQVGFGAVC